MHVDVSRDMQHAHTYMFRKDRRGIGNEKKDGERYKRESQK
jgi:hypothetical protein